MRGDIMENETDLDKVQKDLSDIAKGLYGCGCLLFILPMFLMIGFLLLAAIFGAAS